ncbi:MAG TPA: PAS domain-containing protein [Acidimicrobiales bacterium]
MGATGNRHQHTTAGSVAPEVLLDAVVEMSDDAIFICDERGMVTTWSATAERLFGHSADDVLDGPLNLLFDEHLYGEVQSVMATVLAGDRIRHFETEMLRPDGMPMPVSLSLCPLLDEDKSPIGAVVVARDVTEQRLTQASLAEVDARLQDGEAMAHMGSWLWDLRTGAVQWSTEFHRIHGVDPLEFDGTFDSYLGCLHPADRDGVRSAMVASVESGRPFEYEYHVTHEDRSVHTVQVRAQPTLGSAGTAVGLRGIGQEVGQRIANGDHS